MKRCHWNRIKAKKRKAHLFLLILCFFSVLQGKSCDRGQSFLAEAPESPATLSYRNIIQSESENHCANESPQFRALLQYPKVLKQACVTVPQMIKSGDVHSNSESNRCKNCLLVGITSEGLLK